MSARPIPSTDLDAVLEQTRSLWEEMRGERVFITGGTGFFGAWLLESFAHINRALSLNAHATVLTRNPDAFRKKMPHIASNSSISLLAGDVRDFVFPDGEFRYVIHAATEASAKQLTEAPLEMMTTILDGTRRTLEFAASHGTKRFLLTSSGAVYGRQPAEIVHLPESYTGAPSCTDAGSVYAEGKRASELMCAAYAQTTGMECAIARCWAFCGPHLALDIHFAIGNFIRDVMAGEPIRIGGDGTPTRSYLYAGDLATHLWKMLFCASSLEPYNVGSSHSVSIRELAEAVRDALAPSVGIEIAKQPVAGASISRYVPCTKKIARDLDCHETVGLTEIIRRTAAWYGWKEEGAGGR
ncbi:MAG: NAD-dependent epimerase/dehydratase family protein [Acidobacteria bacterium]|nr:NAD-dependent epimerase/dehydratase family protein [Acidobacteriota bacterium]